MSWHRIICTKALVQEGKMLHNTSGDEKMPHVNRHGFVKLFAGLSVLLVIAALVLPWKFWIEKKLTSILEARGFHKVHLAISALGLSNITFKNISVGGDKPLTLEDVTIGYSLSDVWQGDVSALAIKGLGITIYRHNNQWAIAGLENWSNNKTNASIPVTLDQLADIPLSSIKLENSNIHIISDSGEVDIPFQFTWQKTPIPKLTTQVKSLTFKMHGIEIITGEISCDLTLHEGDKQWDGAWQIKDIITKGDATPMPVMEGKGVLSAQTEHVSLLGGMKSADSSYNANFSMEYALNTPEKSLFTLTDATVPWNSGTLSVHDVKVPLSGKYATEVNLKVQHASIDALMQILTGKRASATGVVSGTIPITIEADGSITFHEGSLKAEEPGTISMTPDAIPGDNEQVAVVRNVLKNLHYTHFSIAVDSHKGNQLSVLLVLEGNNPDVYEGRPVKMNVHLTGDLLNIMQQSVMPFMNPQQLLK